MAQWGNAHSFRQIGEGWRRGEVDLSPFVAPDVTYRDDAMPDHIGETYHGHAGLVRALESLSQPFEDLTVELDRIVGSGDCLVSIHRLRAKGGHTGIVFDEPIAYAWTFRDGKVVQLQGFRNPSEALADLGLEE